MDSLLLKYLRTAADAGWSGSVQVLDGERGLRVAQVPGAMAAGEEITFDLMEVLPEEEAAEIAVELSEPDSWRFWNARGSENEVLEPLAAVAGYRAALVTAADGAILTAHVAGAGVDPLRLGIVLVSLLEVARRESPVEDLGSLEFVCVGHAGGDLLARRVGDGFLLGTLIGPEGDGNEVRAALDALLPEIEVWTREYTTPDRFRRLLRDLVAQAEDEEATLDAVRIAVRERLRLARARREPAATVQLFEKALGMLMQRTLRGAIALIDAAAE